MRHGGEVWDATTTTGMSTVLDHSVSDHLPTGLRVKAKKSNSCVHFALTEDNNLIA